jgi:hypothetical protein
MQIIRYTPIIFSAAIEMGRAGQDRAGWTGPWAKIQYVGRGLRGVWGLDQWDGCQGTVHP